MRDPQFYATALENAAPKIRDARLQRQARSLAARWQALSTEAGGLKLETWQLLEEEIEEAPWTVPAHPAFTELLDDMRRNDVT